MGHLYGELTVSQHILNILWNELCMFADQRGRFELLLAAHCGEERAARSKAPVAKADRRPAPMWKECEWRSANFEKSFLSLKDRGAPGIDDVT